MSARPLYVGIDLGTTNSAAAVFDGEALTSIRNAEGGVLTPSVVRIDRRGDVLVGSKARRVLETDPDNVHAEFKRLMGTEHHFAFKGAGVSRSARELSSLVLASLRSDVQAQLGVAPTRAVVSVPALFELPQTSATSEAARLAGFEQIEMIQEPVASALASGWQQHRDAGALLVYDLGGGTFDASLLESQQGLLRVVGHDGDNFLGGRDFDARIVDFIIDEITRRGGPRVDRKNPAHAGVIRRLKLLAEEAKIELSRSASVSVSGSDLQLDGEPLEVDVELTRAALEGLIEPLLARTFAVCQRLLASKGLAPSALSRVVLVGGPTAMPVLRQRIAEVLAAPIAPDVDPMTVVAHGAALFAAAAHLDGRPAPAPASGPRVWPQHPAMTPELIIHGVALGEPPLSRSIGVALANDSVRVYADRGAPLPLRRSLTHRTVEAVAPGLPGHALRIPIVQGEFPWAHLCRLVGVLELPSDALRGALPGDSAVEVTIEVDRGGRLAARAHVPHLGQVFDQVARLVIAGTTPEEIEEGVADAARRTAEARARAFREKDTDALKRLNDVNGWLEEARALADAARGGDADAAQRARRLLLDVVAVLDEADASQAWPELVAEVESERAASLSWLGVYGTAPELESAERTCGLIEQAIAARNPNEVQRQLRTLRRLGAAAYYREPSAWAWEFTALASQSSDMTDPERANELIARGHGAAARDDRSTLEAVVRELWVLMPVDRRERALGHHSGIR